MAQTMPVTSSGPFVTMVAAHCLCQCVIVVGDGWDWTGRCVRVGTNMTNMTKLFTNQNSFS